MKTHDGYIFDGYVEVDRLGRIVVGRYGVKVYKRKKDILAEGFSRNDVASAIVLVDAPGKITLSKEAIQKNDEAI